MSLPADSDHDSDILSSDVLSDPELASESEQSSSEMIGSTTEQSRAPQAPPGRLEAVPAPGESICIVDVLT